MAATPRQSHRAEPLGPSIDRQLHRVHAAFWWAAALIFSTLIAASPALDYDLAQACSGGALLAFMGFVSSLCAGFPAAAFRASSRVLWRSAVALVLWFGLFAGYTYRFVGKQAFGTAGLLPTFVLMFVLLSCWAALALFVRNTLALQGQVLRVERALADVRGERLARLRSQLAPHFICNALNTIAARIEDAPQTAQRMLTDLADLVRDAVRDLGDRGSVREELARLEPYLALERARFEDQLALELQIEPEVLDENLPPLLLQPLVENAVRHGRTAPGQPLVVRIAIGRGQDGELDARVTNPGQLPPSSDPAAPDPAVRGLAASEPAASDSSGVGVENVRRRLRELYPNQHEFTLRESEGLVVARLRLWGSPP